MNQTSKIVGHLTTIAIFIVLSIMFTQYFFTLPEHTDELPVTSPTALLGVVNSLVITLFSSFVVFVHAFGKGKFNKRILSLIFALTAFVLISLLNGGWKSGLFTVFSISITYIALFDIIRRADNQEIFLTMVKYFFSIAAILPVVIFVLLPSARGGLESYEGHFKGFESSRTTYGFVACIAFAMHLIERGRGWHVWVSLILIGTFMSQSRVAVVIFVVLSIYILRYDLRIKHRTLALGVLSITIPIMLYVFMTLGMRGDELLEESMRFVLLENHINFVMSNLLYGTGGQIELQELVMNDGSVRYMGASAHNFIIETLVGFGLFVTITWMALLWLLWKNTNRTGRVFIVLWVIYGMVHNGFGLSVLTSSNFIVLILAVSMRNYFQEPNCVVFQRLSRDSSRSWIRLAFVGKA